MTKSAYVRFDTKTVIRVSDEPFLSEDYIVIELPDDSPVEKGWMLVDGVLIDPNVMEQ